MIAEWLKENMIAAVTGAVVASAAISGSIVYAVVQPASPLASQTVQGATPAAPPSRFRVNISGNLQGGLGSYGAKPIEGQAAFLCDLTVHKEQICSSGILAPRSGKSIALQLHAGDPTKFRIIDSGTEDMAGVSWEKLRQGVRAFGVTITAEPLSQ